MLKTYNNVEIIKKEVKEREREKGKIENQNILIVDNSTINIFWFY